MDEILLMRCISAFQLLPVAKTSSNQRQAHISDSNSNTNISISMARGRVVIFTQNIYIYINL